MKKIKWLRGEGEERGIIKKEKVVKRRGFKREGK